MTDLSKIAISESFNGRSGALSSVPGFSACENGTINKTGGYADGTECGQTWIAEGDQGWGRWGFSLKDEAIKGLRSGDEIWFRVAMALQPDFDFKTHASKLKCFRIGRKVIGTDENRGYVDWYIHSGTRDWSSIVEFEGAGDWRTHEGGRVQPGKWQMYEVYCKLHPTNGLMRIWCDGKLLTGDPVRATISSGSKAGEVDRLLFYTYWNHESPQTQGLIFDDVAVAVKRPGRDDTPHLSRDAAGNKYIGMDTESGDGPVDPPVEPEIPPVEPPPVDPPVEPPVKPEPPTGPAGDSVAAMDVCENCVFVHTDLPVVVVPVDK